MASIVGKRIKGVVVKEGRADPRSQVFLIFDDGTYYELFSFSMISGGFDVSEGGIEEIRRYMSENTVALAYFGEKDLRESKYP